MKKPSKIRRLTKFDRTTISVPLVLVAFAVVGLGMLLAGRAANFSLGIEAESSTAKTNTQTIQSAAASNGAYEKFGGGAPAGSFSFGAAGDHGHGSDSARSMDTVGRSGLDFYIALGDLSYSGGSEDEWCADFKRRLNDIEVLAGNHDTGESSGGDINKYRQHCPFTLGSLTGDYGKQYHFDHPQQNPLARFIMIAPAIKGSMNINYNSGGAGYVFTRDAIDDARAKGIRWIVVGMHKNCISVGSKSCEIGTDIMDLMIDKKVDLVLQSHDHNYQRTHALKCLEANSFSASCVADDGKDGSYTKGLGPVIIINGEFGRGFYSVRSGDSEAGYFAKMDATTFGITKYTIDADTMSAQYMRSGGGSFADTFVIRADK